MDDAQIKEMVRARYGGIAELTEDACCAPASSCCGNTAPGTPTDKSRQMGYSDTELAAVPDGANLGLGCGNPQAIAALKPGEVVIDLGSGAGFDCFLVAAPCADRLAQSRSHAVTTPPGTPRTGSLGCRGRGHDRAPFGRRPISE
jgi:hypothetical protein